ncbi:hypothetical protein LTR84_011230 [Exophiala bonariae]|uniref:TAFII55 protein conserved region domain-containing protein n=1 Tax=Exophiala bonariae TaxID=1690606 RepID=A0AAV9NL15_9EURO|nr:hypothetical protein LTR84_011230 [Exophiala bonariae]
MARSQKTSKPKPTASKGVTKRLAQSAAGAFVTLKISPHLLRKRAISSTTDIRSSAEIDVDVEDDDMQTRGAWDKNLANSKNIRRRSASPQPTNHHDGSGSSASDSDSPPTNKRKAHIRAQHKARRVKLKAKRIQSRRSASPEATCTAPESPTTPIYESVPGVASNGENATPDSSSSSPGSASDIKAVLENEGPQDEVGAAMADDASKPPRPSLKLSFSRPSIPQVNDGQTAQTPNPQSAVRTPSIKLKLGGTSTAPPTPASATGGKRKKKESDEATPGSATKKRKLQNGTKELPLEGGKSTQPPARPKITFKNTATSVPSVAQTPAPLLKLKSKGKIPKRPPGMGYDSELEDREQDPVILEGFILRMQPGPDCDYLRKQIEEGKIGISRFKGGPEVTLRMLDTLGRRGIMVIKANKYATTLVDLPCIIEGMKSWDKKGWMKSTDICQMLLVLGRCASDDEARNYPLPPDVDPQTYQYAHGLTAPMKWVRKRRFARTKRAKVDDIEAVERRVAALLEADKAAVATRFQLHDSDPRLIEQPSEYFSDEGDDEGAEDAEGEDDDGGYFPVVDELDDDAVNEFQNYWESDGEGDGPEPAATGVTSHPHTGLQPPDAFDSSIAVTSNSASPLVTAAQTPASAAGHSSGDEDAEGDDDDDDDDDEEEERDDDQKEEDEQMRRAKEAIGDYKLKIKQHLEKINAPGTLPVLKRKLANQVQNLRADIVQRKKTAGIPLDDEDEE